MRINIYTDGAARGNPGPAGTGVVIYDDNGKILEEHFRYLGVATNNSAEYQALLDGLKLAKKYVPCSIKVYTDSELMYFQMIGNYRVKNQQLIEHFNAARLLIKNFEKVDFMHIPREKNSAADKLANKAVKTGLIGPI